MKVSIIIPIYNEAATVDTVLESVWAQPLDGLDKEIIVVESNSSDGSVRLVAEFAARHAADTMTPIHVIRQPAARGKGHAVRAGFRVATGDILLIQDADLEYDVRDYPDLLRPIVQGRTSFVLGSRHMGADGWKIRRYARAGMRAWLMNVGGMLFHKFFNEMFGTRLSDPTSMYKVLLASCLDGLTFTCERFDFDYELLGKLIRKGCVPLEVPVSYQSRGFEAGKKIRPFRDPPTWIRAIVATRFSRQSHWDVAARRPSAIGKTFTGNMRRSARRHETS